MKIKGGILLLICVGIMAFQWGEKLLFTKPSHFPEPTYVFANNPLSEAKIQLGRALFYDPILSRNNMISCASCHSQFSAFTHVDHALSHGIEDKIGFRNSPALMNLAWQKSFMRDGAINHLDVQSLAPISNPVEMDENIKHVVSKLQASTLYPRLFLAAFNDSIITGEHTLKAIAQFMLTLVSSNAKYDSVMRHQSQFTQQEQNGYRLFQQHCATCHTEPLFTNDGFYNTGLVVDTLLNDSGRFFVTRNKNDLYQFKVPTLRNIEFSYPYMHDGRFKKLSHVLQFYTQNKLPYPNLAPELRKPIVLTSNEKVDIIAFLLTLTDKSFLFNPQFYYPKELFSPEAKE